MFCNEWYNLSAQVDCLEETLEKSLQAKESPDLRVSILLDYTRGSRGRYYDALAFFEGLFYSCTGRAVIFKREAALADWTCRLKSRVSKPVLLYTSNCTFPENLQDEQLF